MDGAGPAGLATAVVLARRGHSVDLFEGAAEIGGQLNMAKQVPGKEEFHDMIAYYRRQLELHDVNLKLNTRVEGDELVAGGYDDVVLATGVLPRDPEIPGQDHPRVLNYIDVLRGKAPVGKRVAIVGAGGIGFDVAEYLVTGGHSSTLDLQEWLEEWGVVDPSSARGGVSETGPRVPAPEREVTLLQRSAGKLGGGLGKTTGWIHRASLKMRKVRMLGGVNYERIEERGLLISYGKDRSDPTWLEVDNIILCAGQVPLRELAEPVKAAGIPVYIIGGADEASELDAKRAINQGSRLAASL